MAQMMGKGQQKGGGGCNGGGGGNSCRPFHKDVKQEIKDKPKEEKEEEKEEEEEEDKPADALHPENEDVPADALNTENGEKPFGGEPVSEDLAENPAKNTTVDQTGQNGTVTVHSTTGCGACNNLMNDLNAQGVKYNVVDGGSPTGSYPYTTVTSPTGVVTSYGGYASGYAGMIKGQIK